MQAAGIPVAVLDQALPAARTARQHVLQKMQQCSPAPRGELGPHVPRILRLNVPIPKLGVVIGPGGRTVRGIQERSGCSSIDVSSPPLLGTHRHRGMSWDRHRLAEHCAGSPLRIDVLMVSWLAWTCCSSCEHSADTVVQTASSSVWQAVRALAVRYSCACLAIWLNEACCLFADCQPA